MKLYLVRHGDYEKNILQRTEPLSERGRREIQQLAEFLAPASIRVAALVHSGKLRAEQTAEILAPGFLCNQTIQLQPGITPLDNVLAFANEVSVWHEDSVVVGHLPFLGRLLAKLVTGDENKEIIFFQPGTMVCIEKIDVARWIIDWVLCPSLFR